MSVYINLKKTDKRTKTRSVVYEATCSVCREVVEGVKGDLLKAASCRHQQGKQEKVSKQVINHITVRGETKSGRAWAKQFGHGNYFYNNMFKNEGEDAVVAFIEREFDGDFSGTKHRKYSGNAPILGDIEVDGVAMSGKAWADT